MKLKLALKSVLRRWSVIVAALVLAATGALKWHASQMPENVNIPTPTMPSPNARDYYTAAEALMTDTAAIDVSYLTPGTSIGDDPEIKVSSWIPRDRPLTLLEKDRLIAENAPAIAMCHQAMRNTYMDVPARSFTALFPYFSKDRALARLLEFKGRTLAAENRWGDAMDSELDAMKVGADIPHGSILIGSLSGMACQAIGRRHLGDIIPHLSSADAERGARRLEAIDGEQYPMTETMRQEEYCTGASMLQMFRVKHWRKDWLELSSSDSPMSFSLRVRLALESPKEAYDNFTTYMQRTIAQLQLPYPQQIAAKPVPQPHDPICSIFLPVFAGANQRSLTGIALNRLEETQLALQAYKVDYGDYPARLALLAPPYLGEVPIDPYSESEPLVYRRTGATYLLYSIGPDAVDNGGTPITNANADAKRKYSTYMYPSPAGDIVAGVSY